MNCLLTYIILFLLIVLFELNDDIFSFNKILSSNNIVKTGIKKKQKKTCSIPSYVQAQGTYFIQDDNNYQYNHTSQEKMNNLRHIDCSTEEIIDKYIDKFLKMDYDKDIDNIDYDKLKNIAL